MPSVTIPDWVPGIGGQTIGADSAPAAPDAPPDYSARDAIIRAYEEKYGAQIGKASPQQGTVHVPPNAVGPDGKPDPNAGKTITANTGFSLYTFPNGVTVEISDDGQVQNQKLPASATAKPSTTAPTTTTRLVYNSDGSTDEWTYRYDPTATGPNGEKGGFVLDKSLPPVHKPADPSKAPPSDPNTWQKVYANPGDPTSKVIGLIDPKTGTHMDVPATAEKSPQIVAGPNNSQYAISVDPTTHQVSANLLIEGKPDKPQLSVDQRTGQAWTWDGTNYTQISGPTEGRTQSSYDPKTGQTITKTFQNGDWVVTGAAGGPKIGQEGDTRQNIEGGYNVTQTYQNGEWKTTSVGSRATPQQPTQVNAPATSQFITTMDQDGNITTKPNPNYAPTTMAGIAGQQAALQQQARAQHDQINANLQNGVYGSGPDAQTKANAAWADWWNQNIEPQKASLAQAQQQAQFEQQKQQQDLARANYATAQGAGQNAVSNYLSTMPYRVGPGYNQAFGQVANALAGGKMPGNIDMSQLTFKMPDLGQMSQQATAQALAHISPTAAQMANGSPTPSMFSQSPPDINSQLNMTNYTPFGAATPATGAPPAVIPSAAPPTSGPPTTNPVDLSQMPGYNPVGGQSTVLPTLAPLQNPWGQGTGVNFGTYQYGA